MNSRRLLPALTVVSIAVACGGRANDSRDGTGGKAEEPALEGTGGEEASPPPGAICMQSNVNVESADDAESLSACESLSGTLDFRGGSDTPSLESIETINEKLHFQMTTLTDLSVFSGLRDVGVLEIEANDSLESLDGLENLETVWAGIYIHGNPALVDLTALHGVRLMGGPVSISDNVRLPSCQVADLVAALMANDSNIEEVYEADTVPCR